MQVLELAWCGATASERTDRLERLSVDDGNLALVEIRAVDELLLLVRREGDRPARGVGRCPVYEPLREVFAVEREDLDAPVAAVGHVHVPVVRHLGAVNDPELVGALTLGVLESRRD